MAKRKIKRKWIEHTNMICPHCGENNYSDEYDEDYDGGWIECLGCGKTLHLEYDYLSGEMTVCL